MIPKVYVRDLKEQVQYFKLEEREGDLYLVAVNKVGTALSNIMLIQKNGTMYRCQNVVVDGMKTDSKGRALLSTEREG